MVVGIRAMWVGVAVGAGALLVACAEISGLDGFVTGQGCERDCDASVGSAPDQTAGDVSAVPDGADAAPAVDDAPGVADGPAPEDGEVPDAPGEESATEAAPHGDAGEGGCAPGLMACDGGCTSPSDSRNCGACGNVCGADGGAAACEPLPDSDDYVCVPVCPETASTLCDAGCVDTTSDPVHCGTCGNACPAGSANARASCSSGTCKLTCDDGFTACDGGCASLATATNCGGCGLACDPEGGAPLCAPPSADGGAYACSSGCPASAPTRCAGGCSNTAVDLTNCGACGQPCATAVTHATAVCSGGSCSFTCNAGFTSCAGACVDTTTDLNNCGGCGAGHVCGLTQTCIAGVCTSRCQRTSDCPAGYACNGSTCTTACSVAQPCRGGCCQNGTCAGGLAASACGTNGAACVACSAQSNDTACVSGACGCNVATDCATMNACSTALHSCEGLCGGSNTGCNGGCCTSMSGGTCVPGNVDNQCGGTGGQCDNCQTGCSPGPRCLANACACQSGVDCLASSCSGRIICSAAGACH